MEAHEKISLLLSEGLTNPWSRTDLEKFEIRKNNHSGDELVDKDDDDEVDEKLAEEGARFFRGNFFSIFVSMLIGLWSLMFVNTIVRVLALTKKSHTPVLAFQR